jgi:hypothetical protein
MTIMYALRCDLCKKVQVEENPTRLNARAYTENSVTKHACPKCDDLMKASIELGAKGLNKPLEKVAGLIKQRDHERRRADEAMAALTGSNPSIGHSQSTIKSPRGIEAAARIARGLAAQHELPAPGEDTKKRLGGKDEPRFIAHGQPDFKILKIVRMGGVPAQFVFMVQKISGSRDTYTVRGGANLRDSVEAFRKAVREASGGEIGNAELSQRALDQLLSAALWEDAKKKKDK